VRKRLLAYTAGSPQPAHVLRQHVPQLAFVRPFHGRTSCGLTVLRRPLLSYIRPVPDGGSVLARLGNVLYWAGCIAAALWLAMGIFAVSSSKYPVGIEDVMLVAAPTVALWLVGRALRYVLSGI